MLATTPDSPDLPMATIDVEELLKSTIRSTQVEKDVPLTLDVGSLTAYDIAAVDDNLVKQKTDQYILDLTRDNAQILFNELFSLPVELVEKTSCINLPGPTTRLPREKPIPKPKGDTKWEIFAKSKGINKKKRGRMVWDEQAAEWKPRFGYKRVGGDKEQNWVVEVPGNGDPYKDWLGDKEDQKKERVAKNEFKRLKNIGKQNPLVKEQSEEISRTVKQAHLSTASLGKFTEHIKDEKKCKAKGKVKKFAPVSGDTGSEKEKSLALINKIAANKVTVNVGAAANKEMGATVKRSREEERENRRSGRRSKAGVKAQTKHFDKKKMQVSRPGKPGKPGLKPKGQQGPKR